MSPLLRQGRRVDAPGRGSRGRQRGHRRHQGRAPRQGRPALHHHHRGGDWSRCRSGWRFTGSSPATSWCSAARWATTAPPSCSRAATSTSRPTTCAATRMALARADVCAPRRRHRRAFHARRDPRRRGDRPQRDRPGGRRGGGNRRGIRFPIHDEVRGVAEILGIDPLYIANEGKLVAIVAARARVARARSHALAPGGHRGSRDRRGDGRARRAWSSSTPVSAAPGWSTC